MPALLTNMTGREGEVRLGFWEKVEGIEYNFREFCSEFVLKLAEEWLIVLGLYLAGVGLYLVSVGLYLDGLGGLGVHVVEVLPQCS